MAGATEAVVLVHGLWMRGCALWFLQRRLRRVGFATYAFTYRSTRRTPADAAMRLRRFIEQRVPEPTVHFVAHSLGGLVVHRLLHATDYARPGRVVALGTPFQGSVVAQRMARAAAGRWMLGKSYADALAPAPRAWRAANALGVIAGDLNFGLGRLLGGADGPCDGTVGVAETRVPGAAAYCVLRVSHTGMLFSTAVAAQAAEFLRHGQFAPAA